MKKIILITAIFLLSFVGVKAGFSMEGTNGIYYHGNNYLELYNSNKEYYLKYKKNRVLHHLKFKDKIDNFYKKIGKYTF